MLNVSVNVNIAALPSVGSVVSRDMTHAITGRRGALYQLLAIATTRGGPRREIQRVPPHIHTASNNINTIRHKATRLLVSLMPAPQHVPSIDNPTTTIIVRWMAVSFQPPSSTA